MKINTTYRHLAIALLLFPGSFFAQAPSLGSAANFVLFTSNGAITNVGTSQITGDVGSNVGAATGFGNVNGNMQSNNGITALAAADLLTAYGILNTSIPAFFPAPLIGNGATLTAGTYSIASNSTLNNTLTLNAQGTSTAVFIFQISGTFASNANSAIILTNGALACNVYWKVEGAVNLAAGSSMKGNIIANNSAITMAAGSVLEGRALSTAGAIGTNSVLAYTPIGCGSAFLSGPASPTLASTACYAIFSSDGAVTNVGVTTVTGDIGSNNGSALGFNPLLVSGSIHAIPDPSTSQCAVDLGFLYTYLNALPADILLMFPAQFGNNLVLTPHTYLMNGAVTLTDSLYLNAQGNPNGIFVIQINGALSTSAPCKVILMNGTQSKNVFWKVDGAVSLNSNAIFKGTIVANNGAMLLATGVKLDGRVLTTTGALGVSASTVSIPDPIGVGSGPVSQTVCEGSAAIFSVSAGGSGVLYQWRKGTVNLVNSGNISGANSATLSINPVGVSDASALYNIIITGNCGTSYTSPNVSLVVNSSASLSTQVPSQTVCTGASVIFTASATGAGLSYQWRNGAVNLINAGNISGVATATLSISAVSATNASNNYNLLINGICAPNFTSAPFSLVINSSPSLTAQVASQTVCAGTSVSFSVNPTGSGLTYQWQKAGVTLVNGGNISGAGTSTLTINPVTMGDAAANYNLLINGVCAPNFTSALFSLVVNASPSLAAQVASQTICAGNSVTFAAVASGTGNSYQWRNGATNLINGGNIAGATTPTLIINPAMGVDASVNYNLIITGACAPGFTSALISLVVNTSPSLTAQIASQTICAGTSVIFTVNPTGAGLTYQWRKGAVNLLNSGNISGVTTSSLIINPVSNADASTNYDLLISGSCAPSFTSAQFSLVVNSSPSIAAQVPSQTICAGASVVFSVAASGNGLTYQWRKGTSNLVNGGNISGASSPTLTITAANITDASANYNLVIAGVCAPAFTTALFSLIVNSPPSLTAQVPSQTVCAGSSVVFSVVPSGNILTYQWRDGSVDLIDGGAISGATTSILIINPVSTSDGSNNYNIVMTGACAPNYTSALISLIVNSSPSITAVVSGQTVCIGSAAALVATSVGTGLSYQWRKGTTNLVNAGTVSGVTTATLIINPVTAADTSSNYNLIISGVCSPNFTSTNISLRVASLVTIISPPTSQTVCAGSAVSFSTAVAGSGLSFLWRKGQTTIMNGGNISGATTATLTINPAGSADAATDYNLIISGICSLNDTSSNFALTVNTVPGLSTIIKSQVVCVGASVKISASVIGSGLSFQWRRGTQNLTNAGSMAGVNSPSLTITPAIPSDAAVDYNLVISGACAPSYTSANVALQVNPYLTASISGNTLVCLGSAITLVAESLSGGTYNWSGPHDFISTSQSPVINSAGNENGGIYTLTASMAGCAASTATVLVVVQGCLSTEFFIPEGFSPNNDGINDVFVVRGLGNFPNNKFVVFNRWGNQVFEESPYRNTWDGRSSNGIKIGDDQLPVGTYFYILDLGNGSKVYKGTIYLNR
ncbi:MAG: ice-binding family protein [bacterium]|nr:ice-binding family protein [bacterium]